MVDHADVVADAQLVGGSNPERGKTSSSRLEIAGSSPAVRSISRDDAVPFLQRWHYLTFVPKKSNNQWYGIFSRNGNLRGVICVAAHPTGRGLIQKFWPTFPAIKVAELSRMAMVDDWPTNSETVFLSRILKIVKSQGFDAVISYADSSVGHEGTIYRASNWTYAGKTPPVRRLFIDGVEIHPRTCVGRYGSQAIPFLEQKFGERFAHYRDTGKHRFIYFFTKRARRAYRGPTC